MKQQADAWAAKNQVEAQADFVTSAGSKNILTIAAEAQAETGHDIQSFPTWEVHNDADSLEPLDDVMKRLTDKYGQVNHVCDYLAEIKGQWMAVPTSSGTQYKGSRPFHHAAAHIAAPPAPPAIAGHIYNRGTMPTMLAKLKSGHTIDQVFAWASDELEGFTR